MAITDELRNGGTHLTVTDRRAFGEEELVSIADRIDAEHRAALEKLAAQVDRFEPEDRAEPEKGVNWKEEARTWERRCKELITERDERYIALPLDADGVTIRVGDVVTDGEESFVVNNITFYGDGSCSIRNYRDDAWSACDICHYHEPTVEDVLREFADAMSNTHPVDVPARIAEYAARLRLAEEVDA